MTPKPKADVGCRVLNKEGWAYDETLEEFLRSLPKVELHVHLDGSFEHSILKSHLDEIGHDCLPEHTVLPWNQEKFPVREVVENCQNDYREFHGLCTCRGKRSLQEMIKCFEIFLPIVRGNLELLETLAHDFVKRQADQNVIYTEVRYSPHLLAENGSFSSKDHNEASNEAVDPVPVVDAITRGLRRGEREYDVTVNQILCCITWRPDWADSIVQIAHDRREDAPCAVVGVDIAAGEEHFDRDNFGHLHEPHLQAFERAQKLDPPVNVTMHAGEVGDPSHVQRAVERYNAKRIGHGYRIVGNPTLMRQMNRLNRNIHFEVCPTSSVETGGWLYDDGQGKNWEEHPLVTMLQNGLNVGLNSDDPAVFDTSLTFQYRIASTKMKLTREDLCRAVSDSIDAAFTSDDEKKRLRGILQTSMDGFDVPCFFPPLNLLE